MQAVELLKAGFMVGTKCKRH